VWTKSETAVPHFFQFVLGSFLIIEIILVFILGVEQSGIISCTDYSNWNGSLFSHLFILFISFFYFLSAPGTLQNPQSQGLLGN